MALDFATLKRQQREEREGYPTNLGLRVHRALSWLDRAERCEDDDGRFIFRWIAFNAAYANEIGNQERAPEQKVFGRFLNKLVGLDKSEVLYKLIWTEFSSSIRVLLDNQFVFQPFWGYHNGLIEEEQWKTKFDKAKVAANKALAGHNTTTVLAIILSHMYTLRNQLIHGGATWNSSVNREQLRDCSATGMVFTVRLIGHVCGITVFFSRGTPEQTCGLSSTFPSSTTWEERMTTMTRSTVAALQPLQKTSLVI